MHKLSYCDLNRKIILPLLFVLALTPIRPQSSDQIPYDIVHQELSELYKATGTELYKQEAVIEDPSFDLTPSPEQLKKQQDQLEALFYKKRWNSYTLTLMKYILLYVPLSSMVTGASLHFLLKDYLSKEMLMSSALSMGAYTVFPDPKGMLKVIMQVMGKNNPNLFEKYELEYVRNKPWIPQDLQRILEANFIAAYSDPRTTKTNWNNPYLKVAEIALRIPRYVKQLTYNSSTINKTLAGYADVTLTPLKRYSLRHVANSSEESIRKIAAYFYGKPGVGKTRAARLIAKALELPFDVISLGNINIADLLGTKEQPGLLLTALCKANQEVTGTKNMILLIDDVDRILLRQDKQDLCSFILTLLEPETKSFYSPYLEIDIDIAHLGIILAGNQEINDEALANRLYKIYFESYDASYKKEIVWNELLPSILAPYSSKHAKYPFTWNDLTQEDKDVINKMVENDIDSGFRSLKINLYEYIEDKVLLRYFGDNKNMYNHKETKSP
jgi:ATPase family associated with various cellular activities (AAA)